MTRRKGSGVTRAQPDPTSIEPFSWTGKQWKKVFHAFPRPFGRRRIVANIPCHFLFPRYRESGKWKTLPLHLPVRPDLPEGRSGLPWQVWSKSWKTKESRIQESKGSNVHHTKLLRPRGRRFPWLRCPGA